MYEGHVEVVTSYADGVLDTIGADSLPGFTVNAHSLRGQFAEQGVTGFIDNGQLKAAPTSTTGTGGPPGATVGDGAAGGTAKGGAPRDGTATGGTTRWHCPRRRQETAVTCRNRGGPRNPRERRARRIRRRDQTGARVAAGADTRATGGTSAAGLAATAGHAAVPGLPAGTLAIEPTAGNPDLARRPARLPRRR